ncbi:adenylate/guanylate cyclase domain-containing response regulator [Desulfovibrio inopinatus]|uniref:adenylate/guanylate cyclase domain-containing response regulator n=1 Tax=Desulfovibrio inopinatus TaxID=102109 RepID=UPI0003F908CE|nr:adenylate/guanylate cyclase domain-containing response regulator [Desulfovibrio inopinatus]
MTLSNTATPALLLFDDDPERLHDVARVLTPLQYHLHIATRRDIVRSLLDSGVTPSLAILDVFTQGDGCSLARELASPLRHTRTEILMVVPETQQNMIDRALESGVVDVVTRPFQQTLVRARVQSLCRRRFDIPRTPEAHPHTDVTMQNHDHPQPSSGNWRVGLTAAVLCIEVTFHDRTETNDPLEGALRLDRVFDEMTSIITQHDLTIATIYENTLVAISFGSTDKPGSAHGAAEAALTLLQRTAALQSRTQAPLTLRIGMDLGSVVFESAKPTRPAPLVYGAAFSLANLLATTGIQGQIQISHRMQHILEGQYQFEDRGPFFNESTGTIMTFFLTGRRVD